MPIDPSIPLGIQPQPSLMQSLGGTINTASSLVGLQAARQQLQANQVLSNAYSQATDPNTGQTDYNKLTALATQGGAGAFLPDFMGKVATQRNQQLQYDTGSLELALKKQTDLRNRIGSLMADPDYGEGDMSGKIISAMSQAVGAGTLPFDIARQEVGNIPRDPAQQKEWIKQHFLDSLSQDAKIHALLPQTQTVPTGGQTNILNIDPLTGKPTVAGVLQNTMTPGEAATPVQGVTPSGTPYQVTKQQFAQQAMNPQPSGYTGRYQQQPSDLPPGAMQTGLSPSEQAAKTAGASTAATGSATAAQTLHNAASDVPIRVNLLEQARQALQSISTGPGSDWRNTAKSFFNSLSPDLAKSIGFSGDVRDYDEFKKILTNYASSVSGSLGSGTDARLNAAITGNANPNISKLANEDILAKTIAAEKMRAAQDYAFQNANIPPEDFNKWQSQWNKAVDPDAFVFAEMNPQQRQQFIQRMQGSNKLNQFKANLGQLIRAGIVQMPGAQ